MQCRCRGDISCLTDRKKACMQQCTCSWGSSTIERRERLTNCWVHSATQQHWGTHICIMLALSLGTYKTRGVHLTEMRHALMHCISPVTRYIQNQGCTLNTTALSQAQMHYITPVTRYVQNTRGVHLTNIRQVQMHYISSVTRYIQNTRGVYLTKIRQVQMHYISPVTRYIKNTRGVHLTKLGTYKCIILDL